MWPRHDTGNQEADDARQHQPAKKGDGAERKAEEFHDVQNGLKFHYPHPEPVVPDSAVEGILCLLRIPLTAVFWVAVFPFVKWSMFDVMARRRI